MKFKQIWIEADDLQKYLDKYQENVIHIVPYKQYMSGINDGNKLILIIDVSKIDVSDLALPSENSNVTS